MAADKITFFFNSEINKERWDSLINKAVNSNIYACSWFLDIVAPGRNALILGDYEAVMPLPVRQKFGIKYLFQPEFCQQLGVFGEKTDSTLVKMFFNEIPKDIRWIDLFVNGESYPGPGFNISVRRNQMMDIDEDYPELWNSYNGKLRTDIRKAGSFNPEIREIESIEVIKMIKSEQRHKVKVDDQSMSLLLRLLNKAQSLGYLRNFGVFNNEKLEAVSSFFYFKNKVVYFKSANTETGRELRSVHYLLDMVIRENSGNYSYLDFSGSIVPGIEAFYKKFGAKDYLYLHVRKNNLPFFIRWLKN